jgi:8-oxo-dGTP pyrophosphatase MutT (NUDIX family)
LGQLRDQRVEGDLNDDLNQAEIEEMTKDLRLAAVLVPLVEHADEPSILLTRRADHLEKHSGQVAFPGGKVEDSDATPIAAALRETEEEIGLDASHIEIAGVLDTYQTGTGFLILPVVGFVKPGFTLTPDKNEVADVFEVPAHIALSKQNWKTDSGEWKGRMWNFYSMDYQGYNIWGATAGMLMHMSRRIAA